MTIETMRIINSLFMLGSLYPVVYLIYHFIKDIRGGRGNMAVHLTLVHLTLTLVFMMILTSIILSLYVYALIYAPFLENQRDSAHSVILTRNIIKNATFFSMAWIFYYIRRTEYYKLTQEREKPNGQKRNRK